MDNLLSETRSTLDGSVLEARPRVNELLGDIESARQDIMKRAIGATVECGKAMGDG